MKLRDHFKIIIKPRIYTKMSGEEYFRETCAVIDINYYRHEDFFNYNDNEEYKNWWYVGSVNCWGETKESLILSANNYIDRIIKQKQKIKLQFDTIPNSIFL